jgi:G patch domain-containing protein 1
MGWRIGQGIGPRLTWRQRKLQDIQASTGPEVDIDSILEEETEEAKKHTYAPRDTPILRVDRKDNAHGLGYKPGIGLNDSLGVSKGAEGSKGPKLSCTFHGWRAGSVS